MNNKSVHKGLLILASILLAAVLFVVAILLFGGPKLIVHKTESDTEQIRIDVDAVNLSFENVYIGLWECQIERWNGETWEQCPFQPWVDNVAYPYSIGDLRPFQKKSIGVDIGAIYDLSVAGRYRVTVMAGDDSHFHETGYQVVREFRVR